jgi:hypothetical protein
MSGLWIKNFCVDFSQHIYYTKDCHGFNNPKTGLIVCALGGCPKKGDKITKTINLIILVIF